MSRYSKRTYELVSDVLGAAIAEEVRVNKGQITKEVTQVFDELTERFAYVFEGDNSRFDRNRFIDAVYSHITDTAP